MADKGWSKRFDEPIVLDDGTTLANLRQAVAYLAKTVQKAEYNHPAVLTASDHLTRSAEQNYPTFFARTATLQAIHRHRKPVFNPNRKDHHWGKRKLKRDQWRITVIHGRDTQAGELAAIGFHIDFALTQAILVSG